MSNIDRYSKFISEQSKTASTGLFGTHNTGFVSESDGTHVSYDHPLSGGNPDSWDDNNKATPKAKKLATGFESAVNHIQKQYANHPDVKLHDSHDDKNANITIKKGSAPHKDSKLMDLLKGQYSWSTKSHNPYGHA